MKDWDPQTDCTEGRCDTPRTERGRVPGGTCFTYEDDGSHHVFSPCDDGAGYCPASDCISYGPCACLCHQPGVFVVTAAEPDTGKTYVAGVVRTTDEADALAARAALDPNTVWVILTVHGPFRMGALELDQ